MVINEKRKSYDELKEFNGQKYTGMKIGGKHSWNYDKGIWNEVKVTPDRWNFKFRSAKIRTHQAPIGTGAFVNTEYHWYIIADQRVIKLDENSYDTIMEGAKFKIGHKRPTWKQWSYKQASYEDRVIQILEKILGKLKAKKRSRELISFL